MSLDEIIRRKDMNDQFCLMKHRKRDRNIDPVALDISLNEYIESNPSFQMRSQQNNVKSSSGCGRFDRRSLNEDDDSSDDDDKGKMADLLEPDVEMNPLVSIKEEVEDGEDFNDLPRFHTVESRNGIRVRPQQWRLMPENLVDRPPGVKRLEVLPFDESERYRRVRKGKVGKNYRNRTSSFTNNNIDSNLITGTFVEKKGFTFKYGDRNKDGSNIGVIGIERHKTLNDVPQAASTSAAPAAPININMNWNGFFEGFSKCVDKIRKPEPTMHQLLDETSEENTDVVCNQLINLLKAKRSKEVTQKSVLQNISDIQGRPVVFSDEDPNEDNPIVDDVNERTRRIPYNVRLF